MFSAVPFYLQLFILWGDKSFSFFCTANENFHQFSNLLFRFVFGFVSCFTLSCSVFDFGYFQEYSRCSDLSRLALTQTIFFFVWNLFNILFLFVFPFEFRVKRFGVRCECIYYYYFKNDVYAFFFFFAFFPPLVYYYGGAVSSYFFPHSSCGLCVVVVLRI